MPAIRDFTRTAFAAACKRQGFRPFAGAWLRDITTGVGYGMVWSNRGKTVRLLRRESLARAIKLRKADQIKAREAAYNAAVDRVMEIYADATIRGIQQFRNIQKKGN